MLNPPTYEPMLVENEHVCEKIKEFEDVKIDDQLVIPHIFYETKHLVVKTKHVFKRKES